MPQHRYFNQLNYSLANEDSTLEQQILPPNCRLVLSVAGSGSRVLPLLSKSPQQLYVCDIASQQIYLNELRLAALKHLSYQDFLTLLGYLPGSATDRINLFQQIQSSLSNHAKDYGDNLLSLTQTRGIIFSGRFERVLSGYGRICSKLLQVPVKTLFTFENLSDQSKFLQTEFPWWRWRLSLAGLGNAQAFNKLLYKGTFPEKNTKGTMYEYYRDAFETLFYQDVAKHNFFLQLAFLGEMRYPAGYPAEVIPTIWEKAKASTYKTQTNLFQRDLLNVARESCPYESIDFVSFSDVPAYLEQADTLSYLQTLRPKMAKNGLIVVRDYLRLPIGLDSRGFEVITGDFKSLIAQEKTQMYDIQIYRKI